MGGHRRKWGKWNQSQGPGQRASQSISKENNVHMNGEVCRTPKRKLVGLGGQKGDEDKQGRALRLGRDYKIK